MFLKLSKLYISEEVCYLRFSEEVSTRFKQVFEVKFNLIRSTFCQKQYKITRDGKSSIKVKDVQFQFNLITNHTGPMSIHTKFSP